MRAIQSLDELSTDQRGRLPNGVLAHRWSGCDELTGPKEALIETGYVQPSWFPSAPVPYGKKKYKRRFHVSERVLLVRRAKEIWEVCLYRDPNAAEEAPSESALLADDAERDRRATTLTNCIAALPAFVPGSMTEAEIYLVRITRGLNERKRDLLFGLAEDLIVSSALQGMHEQQERKQPKAGTLRLVVNNDRS